MKSKDYANVESFVRAFNKFRLANKNKWLVFTGTVDKKYVEIKTFGNGYLQIMRVNGVDFAGSYGMDMSITGWKEAIHDSIVKG